MELQRTKPGTSARFDVSSGLTNVSSLDWVDVRVANDPNRVGARLTVALLDKEWPKCHCRFQFVDR